MFFLKARSLIPFAARAFGDRNTCLSQCLEFGYGPVLPYNYITSPWMCFTLQGS